MKLEGNIAMAIQFKNKNGEEVTLFNVGPYICDVAQPRLIETDDAYISFGYCYSDELENFLNGNFQYRYNGTSKDISPCCEINNDDEGRFMLPSESGCPFMGNYNIEDAKGSSYFNLEALHAGLIGYNGEAMYSIIVNEEEVRVDDACYLLKCKKGEDIALDDDDEGPRFTKTKVLDYNYSSEELCMILIMMDRKEFDSLDELIDYINDGIISGDDSEWKIDCDKMPISKFAEEEFIHSPKWSYRFVRAYDSGNKFTDEDQDNANGVWFLDSYTIECLAKAESNPDEAVSKMFRKDLAACNGGNILLEVEAWKYYKGKEEDGPDFCGCYSPLVYDYWDSEGEAEKGLDFAIEEECGADGWTQLEYDVKMTRWYNPC